MYVLKPNLGSFHVNGSNLLKVCVWTNPEELEHLLILAQFGNTSILCVLDHEANQRC